ncbi:hypothetical protein GEMRC1_012888 [Eukaryota sp. GEM-RC1]
MVRSKPTKNKNTDFDKRKTKVGAKRSSSNETILKVQSKSLSIKQASAAACDVPTLTAIYPGLRHHAASARHSAVSSLIDAFSNPSNSSQLPSAIPKVSVLLTDPDTRVRSSSTLFLSKFIPSLPVITSSILELVVAHLRAALNHPDLSVSANAIALLLQLCLAKVPLHSFAYSILVPISVLTKRCQEDIQSHKHLKKEELFKVLFSLIELVNTSNCVEVSRFPSYYDEDLPFWDTRRTITSASIDLNFLTVKLVPILIDSLLELCPWDGDRAADVTMGVTVLSVLNLLVDGLSDDLFDRLGNQILIQFPIKAVRCDRNICELFNFHLLQLICSFIDKNKLPFNISKQSNFSESLVEVYSYSLTHFGSSTESKLFPFITCSLVGFFASDSSFLETVADVIPTIKKDGAHNGIVFVIHAFKYLLINSDFSNLDFTLVDSILLNSVRLVCMNGASHRDEVKSLFLEFFKFFSKISLINHLQYQKLSYNFSRRLCFMFVVSSNDVKSSIKRRKINIWTIY